MIAFDQHAKRPEFINVRVKRQDGPGKEPYWQLFKIPYEPELNVITVLQRIAALGKDADGNKSFPVCWDCGCLEEVCGACTMVINGRVRQSCSALVDRLMEDNPDELVLEPMSKFPVIRDLMVDRSRLFRGLKRVKAWVPVDSYYDMGRGERQLREMQERNYPLSQCMSCGCCVEACPQYTKIELEQKPGESDEAFDARKNDAFDKAFVGPHAISQAMLFNNHPTGKALEGERLDALTAPGGIQACGNAQNCVAVCPKEIPLTTSIARAGRATTLHTIRKWFEK
ncbi:succinate dehydrogenase iron-sulfur subunit [Rhodopirellula sp. MGV]|uniref:succinate dehydrogenase iron-sulfur subunit n=1 Tax=Rhodopirellula sp. MGV TaxID=2023130 RepID=UPI000B97C3D1|nr:succinate dehydrogenase iron-sulfur subunit [Rhodopirellula sp. MGV]OYP28843.1 succinate dehydrogenase iron-sulfur subunit [Rhodopirellula sp. MGV]PNY37562.1 succinate dehydrogenase iron-sulfur subunit [Rhodopirellula baltica]